MNTTVATSRPRVAGSLAASFGLALGALAVVAPPADAARGEAAAIPSPAGFDDRIGDMAHGADIKDVRVVNGSKNLRVTVGHKNLRRSFRSGSSVAIYLDADRSKKGPELAFLGGTYEGTDYSLVRTDGWRPRSRALTCSYRMKLDFVEETAAVRIARGCLAGPGAVRVAVKTAGEQRDGDVVHDWLFARRHFTPWVARG